MTGFASKLHGFSGQRALRVRQQLLEAFFPEDVA
jgi:hypothetical protein